MQAVFVCGGRGTRLRPAHSGPKSLLPVGGSTLLAGLVSRIAPLHSSRKPPLVIVDQPDNETPLALARLLPAARVLRQPRPDGVANALLLARPFLDEVAIVTLGDLFLDGAIGPLPDADSLFFARDASADETRKNFGMALGQDGVVAAVIEKPSEPAGVKCGMGVYVLTARTIASFQGAPVDPHTGERGITSGIQAAIEAGRRFQSTAFSGYYNNVNSTADVTAVEAHLLGAAR
jgi:dTDP-glucose pyrophosphorylase